MKCNTYILCSGSRCEILAAGMSHSFWHSYAQCDIASSLADWVLPFEIGIFRTYACLVVSPNSAMIGLTASYGFAPEYPHQMANVFMTTQRVKISSVKSIFTTVNAGVPQGTIFIQIGFIHHINDRQTAWEHVKYVDDCAPWEECLPPASLARSKQLAHWKSTNKDEGATHMLQENTALHPAANDQRQTHRARELINRGLLYFNAVNLICICIYLFVCKLMI